MSYRAKWVSLGTLIFSTMMSMSLWFSATSVQEGLRNYWQLVPGQLSWLTVAVQVGFVAGAVTIAVANLADRFPPQKLFALGSLTGAVANGFIASGVLNFETALVFRFVTGFCCAAVYPVGMKIVSTWTRKDRGAVLGLLVAAGVVGSASPHLIRLFGMNDRWQSAMTISSIAAVVGGLSVLCLVRLGPVHVAARQFCWQQIKKSFSDRPMRLANVGYLGHMWELYAMWTWLPAFLAASFQASDGHRSPATLAIWTSVIGFAAISAGGFGSMFAGVIADRFGRTPVVIGSLISSGACALLIGFTFGGNPILVSTLAIIWGFAIVADSAQFSSCISELADQEFVGTQLTTQTALGFLLTVSSIQLIPSILGHVGWRWAFVPLVIGPIIGSIAMWKLSTLPAAENLAQGRAE